MRIPLRDDREHQRSTRTPACLHQPYQNEHPSEDTPAYFLTDITTKFTGSALRALYDVFQRHMVDSMETHVGLTSTIWASGASFWIFQGQKIEWGLSGGTGCADLAIVLDVGG